MPTCAQVLGKFAAELAYPDIPSAVVEHAKDCIIDTVAVATYGAQFPWSRMVMDYARRYGSGGPCSIIGSTGTRVHAPYAALVNGVFADAFEQGCTFEPGIGTHPGSSVLPPVLAACDETNANGKVAIAAFVAGCEVLSRVAGTSFHSGTPAEMLGFHAPGISGCYGAAVAAGRVLGLNAEQLGHALGIVGSLSAGLLAYIKSKQGGMVKRLHLGRTAESGILAARLASAGYTGPETVLEGKFGFLEVYSRDADPQQLTAGLGKVWDTLRIGMKRYSFHSAPQSAVQALRELMSDHRFLGADVARIEVEGDAKLVSHNNITEPGDMMQAQQSVPFCVALSLFRDPDDPKSLDTSALEDTAIRAVCRNVKVRAFPQDGQARKRKSVRITVQLKDGRVLTRANDSVKGMPDNPLSRAELRHKFMLLSAATGEPVAARLFERLEHLEAEPRFPLV